MGPVHRFARAALAATAVALAISAPAAAHDMGVEVVASGLDNPRGLDLADGTLWVTEAGKGGTGPCVPGPEMTPVCFGLSGALTAIDLQSGAKDRVLSGLPSLANPDGSSATGPSDVSLGRKLWMTIGLGGPTATRDLLPPAGQGMGRLYRLGDLGLEAVADLHAFEVANNPDADQPGSDIESNPNSLDAKAKPVVVADAGGNDILATHFHWSLNSISYFMRAAVFIVPAIVFYLTRRWCIGLQRADTDRLLHGYETGIIMRSPEGGYSERHLPISETSAYTLTARNRDEVHEIESEVDENGVAAPGSRVDRIRAKLSRAMFADNMQKPTAEELEEARHHAAHSHELEAGLDHPAEGHEFDDHALRDADEVPLRNL